MIKILFSFSESVSNETIDGSTGSAADLEMKNQMASKDGGGSGGKANENSSLVDNLDQANAEIERLRKLYDTASGELQGKIDILIPIIIIQSVIFIIYYKTWIKIYLTSDNKY